MTARVVDRLRALLGAAAVRDDPTGGPPTVTPGSAAECAAVLGAASDSGWTIAVEGAGTWAHGPRGADAVLSTRGLIRPPDVSAADLVATVPAGLGWEALRDALADHGTWVALDPPGAPIRTVGSVLATGTAGALRAGFGAVRDHVLGVTIATGDGRIVRAGGRVVKNVAGFDLTKVAVGGFGAFGVIVEAHVRLRAVPRADVTLVARGGRDRLLVAGRALFEAGYQPAALELQSPAVAGERQWRLAVRLMGSDEETEASRDAIVGAANVPLEDGPPHLWHAAAEGMLAHETTVRIGALPSALEEALDLVAHYLDEPVECPIAVCIPAGTVRWTGPATPDALRRVRHAAASSEMPVTVERAPGEVLASVGHFGAYREGTGRLVHLLRDTYDPKGTLLVPLDTPDA